MKTIEPGSLIQIKGHSYPIYNGLSFVNRHDVKYILRSDSYIRLSLNDDIVFIIVSIQDLDHVNFYMMISPNVVGWFNASAHYGITSL